MSWDDFLKGHGIDISNEHSLSLNKINEGSKFFVPYESIYVLVETNPMKMQQGGGQDYLFFLDLTCPHYYREYGDHGKVEIYKQSEDKYIFLQPVVDVNQMFMSDKKDLSTEYLQQILQGLPHENHIEVPLPHSEAAIKEYNQIYDRFLSKKYTFLWGTRILKDHELAKIILSTGHFEPKRVDGVNVLEILDRLKINLALQEDTVKEIFNRINFHDIIVGKVPKNSGIVLYGPGGTGKTTIMKELVEVFKALGSYVALNDENEFLKTSEVKDTKYYGAYQDYFSPKFSEAIREARRRGIPSFIPIDEGDIFVQKPSVSRNSHSMDVINFFKGHVGNHVEFITVLATNVLKEDLDPIATRRGRIATVEIPLPDIPIAVKLIKMFIGIHKIKLERELSSSEFEELARIVVNKNLPGSDISDFCKNFYSIEVDIEALYRQFGGDSSKVEEELKKRQGGVVSVEEFIRKFKKDVGGIDDSGSGESSQGSGPNSNNYESGQSSGSQSSRSGGENYGANQARYDFFRARSRHPTGNKTENKYKSEDIEKLRALFRKILTDMNRIYNVLNKNLRTAQTSFFSKFIHGDLVKKTIDYLRIINDNIIMYDDMHSNLHPSEFYDSLKIFLNEFAGMLKNNADKIDDRNFINQIIIDYRFTNNFLENCCNLPMPDKDSEENELTFLKENDDIQRIISSQGLIWTILGYNNNMVVSDDIIKQRIRIMRKRFNGGNSGNYVFFDKSLKSAKAQIILKEFAVLINLIADLYNDKNKRINGKMYLYSNINEFLQIKIDISNLLRLFE